MTKREEEAPARAYRVRDRRAPAVWVEALDHSETLRAHRKPGAKSAPPMVGGAPAKSHRSLFVLGVIVVLGALTGLVLEHTMDWYSYDFEAFEGLRNVPQQDAVGRTAVLATLGSNEEPYFQLAVHGPTWGWSILIATGTFLALLERSTLSAAFREPMRMILLGGMGLGGLILAVAGSRLVGSHVAFASANDGMIETPTWILYGIVLAGAATLTVVLLELLPLLQKRIAAQRAGPGTARAYRTLLLVIAVSGTALILSPWLPYAVQDEESVRGFTRAVVTDAQLSHVIAPGDRGLADASLHLTQVRTILTGLLLLAVGFALAPALLSRHHAQRLAAPLMHAVALAGPFLALAVIAGVRALLGLRDLEAYSLGANHVLLAASMILALAYLRYLATGAWPAIQALRQSSEHAAVLPREGA